MPIVLCSQLPPSRLFAYAAFSTFLSGLALWRYTHFNFPEETNEFFDGKKVTLSLERVMQDKCAVVATFNMVFCLLIAVVKGFQRFFFGDLVGNEPQIIRETFIHFALSRAVFLIGVINATKWSSLVGWTLWFGCFSCLYGFTRLARFRCEQHIARNNTSKWEWLRFGSMLTVLNCLTLSLLFVGLKFCYCLSDVTPESDIFGELSASYKEEVSSDMADDNSADLYQILHVLVFMVSDLILVLMLLLQISLIVAINKLDDMVWIHQLMTFDKSAWLYYNNLVFDVFGLFTELSNHVHMLLWSRMASLTNLVVCVQIYMSYGNLAQRLRHHLTYRKLVKIVRKEFSLEHIDKMAVGTDEARKQQLPELENCAICWDSLWTWRKLPCQHRFHETCLISWIEQDASCPTCRRQINFQTPQQPQMQPTAVRNTAFRIRQNVFGRIVTPGTPEVSIENQRPVRGMFVRLRQQAIPTDNLNSPTASPSLYLSIRVRLGSGRQAVQQPAIRVQQANVGRVELEPQQTELVQSTSRSHFFHFDGSNYVSWLPTVDIEFLETEQQVALIPPNPTAPGPETDVAQRQPGRSPLILRLLSLLRSTAISNQQLPATVQSLTPSLRVQAEEISAAFPAIQSDAILADLAVTRIPEVTVENILAGRLNLAPPTEPPTRQPPFNNYSNSDASANDEEVQVRYRERAQFRQEHMMPIRPLSEIGVDDVPSSQMQTPPHPLSSSSSPSSLIAHRRQQFLLRARQRFLATRQKHQQEQH